MNKIKIMPNEKFDLDDLLKVVDFSHPFTLRSVLKMCVSSEIPIKVLESILHCPYIEDYYNESESKPFSNDGNIEYLEIYWLGAKDDEYGQMWCFHGVGYVDQYPEDMVEWNNKNGGELPKNFREQYAIEFSPMYELSDYIIKMLPKLRLTNYSDENDNKDIDFTPSITLIELLYAIFWELSFCGSIENREQKKSNLEKSLKEITAPHEEVKRVMEEKFGKE